MVVVARRAWMEYFTVFFFNTFKNILQSISDFRTQTHLWSQKEKISSEQQLSGGKCLLDVRGQRSDW